MGTISNISYNRYNNYSVHQELEKYFYYNYGSFPKITNDILFTYCADLKTEVGQSTCANLKTEVGQSTCASQTNLNDINIYLETQKKNMSVFCKNDTCVVQIQHSSLFENMDFVLKLNDIPLKYISEIMVLNSKKFINYKINNLGIFTYNYAKYPNGAKKNIWVIPNLILHKCDTLFVVFLKSYLVDMWQKCITTTFINKDIDSILFLYFKLTISFQIISKQIVEPKQPNTVAMYPIVNSPVNIHYINQSCNKKIIDGKINIEIFRSQFKTNKTINFMFFYETFNEIIPIDIFKKLEMYDVYKNLLGKVTSDDIGIFAEIENNHYRRQIGKKKETNPPTIFKFTEDILCANFTNKSIKNYLKCINFQEILQDTILMGDDWDENSGIDNDKLNIVFDLDMQNLVFDSDAQNLSKKKIRLFLQF